MSLLRLQGGLLNLQRAAALAGAGWQPVSGSSSSCSSPPLHQQRRCQSADSHAHASFGTRIDVYNRLPPILLLIRHAGASRVHDSPGITIDIKLIALWPKPACRCSADTCVGLVGNARAQSATCRGAACGVAGCWHVTTAGADDFTSLALPTGAFSDMQRSPHPGAAGSGGPRGRICVHRCTPPRHPAFTQACRDRLPPCLSACVCGSQSPYMPFLMPVSACTHVRRVRGSGRIPGGQGGAQPRGAAVGAGPGAGGLERKVCLGLRWLVPPVWIWLLEMVVG